MILIVGQAVSSSIQINSFFLIFLSNKKKILRVCPTNSTKVKYRSGIGLENPCWLLNKYNLGGLSPTSPALSVID